MIPIHVSQDNLINVIEALKGIKNFCGLTVTIPHKTSVAHLCDTLEPDAEITGAVNWIRFDEKRNLVGNNFDGKGFVNGFLKNKYSLKNKTISLFGAGGAAASIACSLVNENIKYLKIINRDIKKAQNLNKTINRREIWGDLLNYIIKI